MNSREQNHDHSYREPGRLSSVEESIVHTLFNTNSAIKLLLLPGSGRILDATPSACQFYGYSMEILTRMRIHDLNAGKAERVQENLEHVLNKRIKELETHQRTASGDIKSVHINSAPIQLGGRTYILSIVQDITQRKAAEEALRHERMLVDTIMEHVPDVMFLKDHDGRYRTVNRAFLRLFDFHDASDVVGRTDQELLPTGLADALTQDEDGLYGRKMDVSDRVIEVPGGARSLWLRVTKVPTFASSGKVLGILGIGHDITEPYEQRQHSDITARRIHAVIEIADELLSLNSLDDILRRAVEQARNRLGIDRCGIFLNRGTHIEGSYGTDMKGNTVNEHDYIMPIEDRWRTRLDIWRQNNRQWLVERDMPLQSPSTRDIAGKVDWVAMTPIKGGGNRTIGIFCNDSAMSGKPIDNALQNILTLYCSLLGSIIDRHMSMEQMARRDQILEMIATATHELLSRPGDRVHMSRVLGEIGGLMKVDNLAIVANRASTHGELNMKLYASWAEDLEAQPTIPNVDMRGRYFTAYHHLINGDTHEASLRTTDESERFLLSDFHAETCLIAPIRINDNFWGMLCAARRTYEAWSHLDRNTLLSLAAGFGGIINRQETDQVLQRRDTILNGVAKATHILLTDHRFPDAIRNALSILGQAMDVDRTYLFQNQLDPLSGQPNMRLQFIWNRNPTRFRSVYSGDEVFSYSQSFPGWYELMMKGRPLYGRVMDFLAKSSNASGEFNIRSILFAPVMIGNEFWGFIGFDDRNPERDWSESDMSTLMTIAGSIGGAISRMEAQEKLRASEENFRSLTENATDIVLKVRDSGHVLYASPSVQRELGYDPAELESMQVFALVHPEDGATVRKGFHQAATSTEPVVIEFRIRHREASWRDLECGIKRSPAGSERQVFIFNARDITRRKESELALREKEELLRHSQKMEAIGRLAGGVAHDFNNLLTAIMGYGELALAQIGSCDPVHKDVAEMYRAAERAHRLTRQLLAFSRKQLLEPKTIHIAPFIEEVMKLLRRLISENITLETDIAPDSGMIKVDPSHLEQIVVNLALNARDAMGDSGTLTIRTRNSAHEEPVHGEHMLIPAGSYVELIVEDTGCGIADSIKDHIFEPFFTTKPVGKGTGLGLSMVYGIVEKSDGFIHVDSAPGKGARFHILFPRVEEKPAETNSLEPVRDTRGRETILLVEDEPVVRNLTAMVLTKHGYRVTAAEDGEAGLKRLRDPDNGRYNLILTDIVMPNMNGHQLAQEASRICPGTPVLYMSGYAEETISEFNISIREDNYVAKPFTTAQLCEKIRQILDRPDNRNIPATSRESLSS